jgi:hypothetical protein
MEIDRLETNPDYVGNPVPPTIKRGGEVGAQSAINPVKRKHQTDSLLHGFAL